MSTYKSRLDGIGIAITFLCLVHCLLLPVLVTTLPLFGIEVLQNDYIETGTVLLTLLVGGRAIWKGYKNHHRHRYIVVVFAIGIGAMVSSDFMQLEIAEMMVKGTGAVLVITAHIINWRNCRRCNVCEQDKVLFRH